MFKSFFYLILLILSCSDYNLSVAQEENNPPVPVISVTPDFLFITNTNAGCETTEELTIKNIGTGVLEITNIEYFITLPVNFTYDLIETTNGELPWYINAGDEKKLTITYMPTDDMGDSAFVEIDSNDMSSPTYVPTDGEARYHSWVTDEFEQEALEDIDILFVIDNSGSMRSVQTSVADNFDSFISMFTISGVDYHIAFITTDSPDFVGDIVTPLFSDPVLEANNQIGSIGVYGSANETGIEMAYNALRNSGDAAPGSEFLRESAKLVIIIISDEDDHGSITPSVSSSYFMALKTSSSYVTTHAVIGLPPTGCQTSVPGTLYDELVQLMNGTSLSICETDWGTPMEQLAIDSMNNVSFTLSNVHPVETTIEVMVDNVISYNWTYDGIYNSIVFDISAIPQSGQTIVVNYAVYGQCL